MSAKYFCANCGSIVEQGIKFCANCGTSVSEQQPPQQPPQQAAPAAQAYTPAQPYAPAPTYTPTQQGAPGGVSPHNRTVTLLLCIFLGYIGVHKFYVGKTGEGVAYFLLSWTLIPAFIAFIEIFIIAAGSFRDDRGLPVLTW
jgi:DNA-directed RNA polymerase subunit RPC12/RpoP